MRIIELTLLAVAISLVCLTGAEAQAPGSPSTKFQYMPQSFEALLNSGYEIRESMGMGMMILAKRDGGTMRWAACTMHITNGMMSDPTKMQTTTSNCFALN